MVRLRVRGPDGVATLNLPDSATVGELKTEIASKSKVDNFDLKRGYPPQPFSLDDHDSASIISETGLQLNGEQLIVSPRQSSAPAHQPPPPPPPEPNSTDTGPKMSSSSAGLRTQASPPKDPSEDPPELPLANHGGVLLMRVMPDDNSCLFRAVSSAVLGTDIDMMFELRSLVADKIRSNPETYSAAILDKEPEDYCRWIQTDAAWGGAIEMGILAEHFQIEIASISVQHGRVDRFNEGASRRCILVYSSIHYDVLAISPEDSLGLGFRKPPEHDVKLFDVYDEDVLTRALELCAVLRQRNYYTDTAQFKVRCNDCGWTGNGEKALVKHAEATNHWNFGEAST